MKTFFFGNEQAGAVLLQPVDGHDLALAEREAELIGAMTGGGDFLLAAVRAEDWNEDLSPWPAPSAYGKEGFGSGAERTLAHLLEEVMPPLRESAPAGGRRFYLGGYSLAGLFALWAAYRTDAFSGVAAASPSVWFPGFREYTRERPLLTEAVYLSLGTKEEKTRHPLMSQVGQAIRELYGQLSASGAACALEWNEGNHFREPEKRMAQGFAWLLSDR